MNSVQFWTIYAIAFQFLFLWDYYSVATVYSDNQKTLEKEDDFYAQVMISNSLTSIEQRVIGEHSPN